MLYAPSTFFRQSEGPRCVAHARSLFYLHRSFSIFCASVIFISTSVTGWTYFDMSLTHCDWLVVRTVAFVWRQEVWKGRSISCSLEFCLAIAYDFTSLRIHTGRCWQWRNRALRIATAHTVWSAVLSWSVSNPSCPLQSPTTSQSVLYIAAFRSTPVPSFCRCHLVEACSQRQITWLRPSVIFFRPSTQWRYIIRKNCPRLLKSIPCSVISLHML